MDCREQRRNGSGRGNRPEEIAMPSLADVLAAQTGAPGPVYEPGGPDAGITMADVLGPSWLERARAQAARDAAAYQAGGVPALLADAGDTADLAGGFGGITKIANPIRAYHGSPYNFDKFSLENIGTGEGAQVYGHGLYFAENPAVAQEYKDALGESKYTINGIVAPDDIGTQSAIAALVRAHPGSGMVEHGFEVTPELLARARQQYLDHLGVTGPEYLKDFEGLGGTNIGLQRTGKMYEVNLHARPEQFLNWDAPIAQQNEALKSFINENRQAGSYIDPRTWDAVYRESPAYGSELYQAMTSGRGGMSAPEATTALREAGIPGIRYLDQGSRNINPTWTVKSPQGGLWDYATEQQAKDFVAKYPDHTIIPPKQTSNYVVFDPNIIDILKKYAIPGMTGATMADVLAGQREQQ